MLGKKAKTYTPQISKYKIKSKLSCWFYLKKPHFLRRRSLAYLPQQSRRSPCPAPQGGPAASACPSPTPPTSPPPHSRNRAGEAPAQPPPCRPAASACFPLLQASLLALTAVRKQQYPPSRPQHTDACRSVQPALQLPQAPAKVHLESPQSLTQGLREAPPFNWNPTNQKVTPDASPAKKERQSFALIRYCLFCPKTLSFTFIPSCWSPSNSTPL